MYATSCCCCRDQRRPVAVSVDYSLFCTRRSPYRRRERWIMLPSRRQRVTLSVTLQWSSHDDACRPHCATLPPPTLPMPPQPSPTIASPLVPTRRSLCRRHLLSNQRTPPQVGLSLLLLIRIQDKIPWTQSPTDKLPPNLLKA